jgi:hypothetical protein
MIDEMLTYIDSNTEKPRRKRQRLSIEYLIGLIGYEAAIRFCMEYAGCQLPSRDRVHRFVRRHSIIADHLNRCMAVAAIARKYKMTPGSVRKIITEHLESQRALKRLNQRLEEAEARRAGIEATS